MSMSRPRSIYLISTWSIFHFQLIFIVINHITSFKQTYLFFVHFLEYFLLFLKGFPELRSQSLWPILTHSQPLPATLTHFHPFFKKNNSLPPIFQEKRPTPIHFSTKTTHSYPFFNKNNPLPPSFQQKQPTPTHFSTKTSPSQPFLMKNDLLPSSFNKNNPIPSIFQQIRPTPTYFSIKVTHSHHFHPFFHWSFTKATFIHQFSNYNRLSLRVTINALKLGSH